MPQDAGAARTPGTWTDQTQSNSDWQVTNNSDLLSKKFATKDRATGSAAAWKDVPQGVQASASVKDFIAGEIDMFFAADGDKARFLQILVHDGLVS